jgi:2-dehydro-3-deoxygalactonokinase
MQDRIVVDWGSSNFRAYRFGPDGTVIDRHQAAAGILSVIDGRFEDTLRREIGPWMAKGRDICLSGMITSRNGWVETPYLACPATVAGIARHALVRELADGTRLHFMPGVSALAPSPDVMRGEEMQVFGTVGAADDATIVLPGTHSKWVRVAGGAINGLRTFLTGDVFALLSQHSIVGRLMPKDPAPFDEGAFLAGVDLAFSPASISLLNDIFTARSGALLGAFPVESIASRLSGMLIGHELAAGLALEAGTAARLVLIGEPVLVQRYALALAHRGRAAEIGPAEAAVEGFRKLASTGALA